MMVMPAASIISFLKKVCLKWTYHTSPYLSIELKILYKREDDLLYRLQNTREINFTLEFLIQACHPRGEIAIEETNVNVVIKHWNVRTKLIEEDLSPVS